MLPYKSLATVMLLLAMHAKPENNVIQETGAIVNRLMIFIGMTLGGWLGWWVGAKIGFMTGFIVSGVGSIIGVYIGWRINREYFG